VTVRRMVVNGGLAPHKVDRRNELVDGTIEAIRRLGRFLSMDEIARNRVSKTSCTLLRRQERPATPS